MSDTTDDAYGKGTQRLWGQFKQGKLTPEEYKRESMALFELWKEAQQESHEHELRLMVIKTPSGWKIELDNDTWVQLIAALTSAIESRVRDGRAQGEQAEQWRALRTMLSRVDKSEGF